ncbi:MAG: 2-oxo acid dehydrogenase subunit E2 [Lachnospiraceae bacterium]|nr:2-oxo acid dehydrogenase subunit E2 [Lachnospiraceae bacterium]
MGKRRLGDRNDATLIRDIDAMHYIMPLIMPNRCDNEAHMKLSVDISLTEKYVREYNRNHPDQWISVFDIVIAAALKMIRLRPHANRFITNNNIYQRNNISAAFTVKKDFRDDGDETLARIEVDDNDDLESIIQKVRSRIALCKIQDDEATDAMNLIKKIPGKHIVGMIARFLDRHGWMPQSIISGDPYQSSVVLANLGSLGMDIGYHHLINWGTTSLFIIVGSKKNRNRLNKDGTVTTKRELDLAFTIDERISDGFYYARSLRLIKTLIENPKLLEGPLSREL